MTNTQINVKNIDNETLAKIEALLAGSEFSVKQNTIIELEVKINHNQVSESVNSLIDGLGKAKEFKAKRAQNSVLANIL